MNTGDKMSNDIIMAWVNGDTDKIQRTKDYIDSFAKYEIRDYSHEKGGVLHVPTRDYETGKFASVSEAKLKHEEGLTRAMFNSRILKLDPFSGSADKSHTHRVISFEAPLRRTPERVKVSSRSMACDLVTVASYKFRLTAVEVKRTKGDKTNLDYGIVEAWLYAQALARLISDDLSPSRNSRYEHLKREIRSCCQAYGMGNQIRLPGEAKGCGVEYAIAGPESYFKEQFEEHLVTSQGVDSLLEQLRSVDKPASTKPNFAGFWLLPDDGDRDKLIRANTIFMPDLVINNGDEQDDTKERGVDIQIPTLASNKLVLCPDVDGLVERVTR